MMTRIPRPIATFTLPYRPSLIPQSQRAAPPQLQHQPQQQQQRSLHLTTTPIRPSLFTPITHPTQPTSHNHLQHIQIRQASTARRQRKLHRLPPAAFQHGPDLITGSSGRSRTAAAIQAQVRENIKAGAPTGRIGDQLLFTPAPSVPNAYHTPVKFLPVGDVRRKLWEQTQSLESSMATTSTTSQLAQSSSSAFPPRTAKALPPSTSTFPPDVALPPAVRQPYEKSYHLGPADIEEIRRLRAEDGEKWNSYALAKRFQCSRIFVAMCAQGSEERVKSEMKVRRKSAESWGPRRRKAREERGRRREAWGVEA